MRQSALDRSSYVSNHLPPQLQQLLVSVVRDCCWDCEKISSHGSMIDHQWSSVFGGTTFWSGEWEVTIWYWAIHNDRVQRICNAIHHNHIFISSSINSDIHLCSNARKPCRTRRWRWQRNFPCMMSFTQWMFSRTCDSTATTKPRKWHDYYCSLLKRYRTLDLRLYLCFHFTSSLPLPAPWSSLYSCQDFTILCLVLGYRTTFVILYHSVLNWRIHFTVKVQQNAKNERAPYFSDGWLAHW